MAAVGQGEGRQGAGGARRRCRVLCLLPRRVPMPALPSLPLLPGAEDAAAARPPLVRSACCTCGVCPEKVGSGRDQPAAGPGLQDRESGRGRVGPNPAGSGACLIEDCTRTARVPDPPTARSSSAVGCASPTTQNRSVPPVPLAPGNFADQHSHPHLPGALLQTWVRPVGPA